MSIEENRSELNSLIARYDIHSEDKKDRQFLNRHHVVFPDQTLSGSFGYVFFTKPSCNFFAEYSNGGTLVENTFKNEEFNKLIRTDKHLFIELQAGQGGNDFIKCLSNKAKSFTPTAEIIKTRDSAQNTTDFKVTYAHRNDDSIMGGTFDITFQDDRWLTVHNILHIWTNYMSLISKGYIEPHKNRRLKRELDYACSVYYFLTDETGERIIYFCKLIGVFPTSNASDNLGWTEGEVLNTRYSVPFQYSIKKETPSIIKDFNKICGIGNANSMYDVDGRITSTWHSSVFIQEQDGEYYLKFGR